MVTFRYKMVTCSPPKGCTMVPDGISDTVAHAKSKRFIFCRQSTGELVSAAPTVPRTRPPSGGGTTRNHFADFLDGGVSKIYSAINLNIGW